MQRGAENGHELRKSNVWPIAIVSIFQLIYLEPPDGCGRESSDNYPGVHPPLVYHFPGNCSAEIPQRFAASIPISGGLRRERASPGRGSVVVWSLVGRRMSFERL